MKKLFIFTMTAFCLFCLWGCDSSDKYDKEYIVTIVDGDVTSGKELMDSFYIQTQNDEKLKITFNIEYTNLETSYSYYILYDGEYYITNYKILANDSSEQKFKYLNYSETNGNGKSIIKTEAYCLSNDKDVTYEKIRNSWFSSVLMNTILNSIPVYCYNYYVDLCFSKTEVESIVYDSRKYDVNLFNKITAAEIADCLSWKKEQIENYDNDNWTLKLEMTRTILNDNDNLLLSEKKSTIFVEYLFNFEKKIAVMQYQTISSKSDQLYAVLTDECLQKINDLFCIFQSQSETNWGEYYNDLLIFEINKDGSGIINVIGTNITEKIYVSSIKGDGYLKLQSNYGENYYVFTMHGENNGGYTYISEESNPTETMKEYFENNVFFKWIGYSLN